MDDMLVALMAARAEGWGDLGGESTRSEQTKGNELGRGGEVVAAAFDTDENKDQRPSVSQSVIQCC